MRAVLQRVSEASVRVDGELLASIDRGILLLLGIESADTSEDIEWLLHKICGLRIFEDEDGQMNLSLQENNGELLVISQFTLFASTRKGRRPGFSRAAAPAVAEDYYREFLDKASALMPGRVKEGRFGADMKVALLNDGPVTIIIDTKNKE